MLLEISSVIHVLVENYSSEPQVFVSLQPSVRESRDFKFEGRNTARGALHWRSCHVYISSLLRDIIARKCYNLGFNGERHGQRVFSDLHPFGSPSQLGIAVTGMRD